MNEQRAMRRWLLHGAVLLAALALVTAADVEVRLHPTVPARSVGAGQPALPVPTRPAPPRSVAEGPRVVSTPVAPRPTPTPDPCAPSVEPVPPLPAEDDPSARDFWRNFDAPLPRTSVWNPPGPKRVGIQAGHWLRQEVPWELHHLDFGGSGGGRQEWEVTLDLAERVQQQLEAVGVQVDVLPVAVPERYAAHVFVAIHADVSVHSDWRGFKIARPVFSAIPEVDDRLVDELDRAYAAATDLPRDPVHISDSMREYYAFNSRRYCHAVAPGVPQAIIETGYLTNADDRAVLFDDPDVAARGISDGIRHFLDR